MATKFSAIGHSENMTKLKMFGYITDPAPGVEVSVADLLVPGEQIQKFEDEHDLMRRVSGGAGSVSPYDWEGMTNALIIRIHEKGLPATQSQLVADTQEWFIGQADGGQIPDERSIRRRISNIWKTLSQLQKTSG